jgi:hypothetical protein
MCRRRGGGRFSWLLQQYVGQSRCRSAVATVFDFLFICYFIISVPCDFDTPISIYVGGKEIKISPDTFNLGPLSTGSDRCLAGAASDDQLTGGKLAPDDDPWSKLTWIQNSGFSVTSSCKTLTLLGILTKAVSALLILPESRNYFRFSSE